MFKFLELLFEKNEWVNICSSSPKESRNVYPLEHANQLRGKYFCVNPITPGMSRKQLNLSDRRNFLIEFDEGTIEEQHELIRKLNIPYRTMVFSGNKSLHVIIALKKGVTKAQYRALAARLRQAIPQADPACFEPARLSRLNGYNQPIRNFGNKITVKELDIWLTKLGFPAKEEHNNHLDNVPEINTEKEIRLAFSTKRLLTGDVKPHEAHRVVLGAAKNLQEMGYTMEETTDILAQARQLVRKQESWAEAVRKTKRVVDWVYTEWVEDWNASTPTTINNK